MIVKLPGLIDVHTHMREPGGEHKETFETGTSAALAGGVTAIFAMPNTTPPITDEASFALAIDRANKGAKCDYALFVGGTHRNPETISSLHNRAAGLKIYVNDTFGPLRVESYGAIRRHLENWKGKGPVCFHAEKEVVERVVEMAAEIDTAVHICHVSRKQEIEAIKQFKERGVKVTCEVTPHHLYFTEKDFERLGAFGDVRPMLASEEDRVALWDNFDVIDCIATDHAPHTKEEKANQSPPPPGLPGVETSLPLMLNCVAQGKLTIDRLIELTNINPRRIFNLPEQSNTYVEVDTDYEWTLPETGWYTKTDWSPFAGLKIKGKVIRTVLRGEVVFEDGKVLAPAGAGINLRS
ncbi:MAG: amidohydrolase family protein [Alphaproteobacteria bacterium]|nr:amidohydrolase family protein [Alphaproteobacteria bacterium]